VSVVDEQGRVVPAAANPVTFKLEGPGRIIGVGNGDPSSHEPDKFVAAPTLRTRALDDWRWKKVVDSYAPDLPEVSAKVDDSRWAKADVRSERGPLGPNDRAVFRTRLTVSAEDLAASGVELWFGKIDGGIAVFLNGRKIAPTGDPRAPSVYDVKALLRPGENSVAVTLATWGEVAGVNKGAMLRLVDQPRPPDWHRSVFAGLAQTIIQSTNQSGTVRLTAQSSGLSGATLSLATRASSPRALLP